jgi:phosphomannomutase
MTRFLLSTKTLRAPLSQVAERIAVKHGAFMRASRREPLVRTWFEGPDLPEPAASARVAAILADLEAAGIAYPVYDA